MSVNVKVRADWQVNHKLIKESYVKLVTKFAKKEMGAPSITDVAEDTGLAYMTIRRHFKNISFEPKEHVARALTDEVILSIARSAIAGIPASQKLWMQIMEGWNPNAETENDELEETQTIPNFMDGRLLMDRVIMDIAIEQGKDVGEITKYLSLSAHKESVQDAEMVEEGMQKPYDFDVIERKHKGKKKVEVEATNGNGAIKDIGEDVRAQIKARLEKGAVMEALKSVKDKSKKNGSNGQAQ